MEKLLSLPDAAKLAGVADKTFWQLCRQGKGPATVMVGKRQRITPQAWQAWLDSLEPTTPAPAPPSVPRRAAVSA